METDHLDMTISKLGPSRIPSPMPAAQFIRDEDCILYDNDFRVIESYLQKSERPPRFEMAGPRKEIYFDPSKLKCGIVTCGGLCPGLNDVIRAIVMGLYHHYGVKIIFGFRFGYEGLSYRYGHAPLD